MTKKIIVFALLVVAGMWCGSGMGWAQQQAPDTILYNGKIVTVDNHEVNENLGTIAQALAIREGKIVAVGNNAGVRRLAGTNTESIDLKGRTVVPGFIVTHDHPQDWNTLNEKIVSKVVNDDNSIQRFINVSPDEVTAAISPSAGRSSLKGQTHAGKMDSDCPSLRKRLQPGLANRNLRVFREAN